MVGCLHPGSALLAACSGGFFCVGQVRGASHSSAVDDRWYDIRDVVGGRVTLGDEEIAVSPELASGGGVAEVKEGRKAQLRGDGSRLPETVVIYKYSGAAPAQALTPQGSERRCAF